MKKLFFMSLIGMSMIACTGNNGVNTVEPSDDSDSITVVDPASVDTMTVDSL